MRYTVFLGAPSPSSTLNDDGISYQWRTITSTLGPASQDTSTDLFAGFPSSALDAASHRISVMYENVIFVDEDEVEGDTQIVEEDLIGRRGGETKLFSKTPFSYLLDQTTLITWATSTQPERESDSASRLPLRGSISISGARTSSWQHHLETQQEGHPTTTASYVYSDTSSIARFPNFQFSLGTLSVLASAQGKTCVLLAVLEVDGPDEVTVRRGPDTGHVVSVLRLIVGDEASTIRKLTAWREVAETWGGATQDAVGIRCGDVVYFESTPHRVLANTGRGGVPASAAITPGITASPNLHSRSEICYRTMPRTSVPADMQLRPDLRLGASDAAVRRVAAVVSWFESMAGLSSAAK
ncbi:hypothetical protein DFH94DRAFT_674822 [Russula ochroleuca]|uniref:Uncharacterized protein n=1 Tax=Russula ochroleuca TaxID=152965 RepID=A0A9P5MR19_9AGAM|nr:hypothetical protein DFH94DRAFT_674822 [Russula ochroleuca]